MADKRDWARELSAGWLVLKMFLPPDEVLRGRPWSLDESKEQDVNTDRELSPTPPVVDL